MFKTIKKTCKNKILYYAYRIIYLRQELQICLGKNKPIPLPASMKQKIIEKYAKTFSISALVETGTYFGDMVNATKKIFGRIYSIELDKTLYERAKKRFSNYTHITIIQGDSSEILPGILSNITQPCLFWLDAHYSGGITAKGKIETPIIQELHYILGHTIKNHVILIDDARMFVGLNDYPTINEVKDLIRKTHPEYICEVKDDIIRIHSQQL